MNYAVVLPTMQRGRDRLFLVACSCFLDNPAIILKNCTGLPRSNLTPGVPFGIVLLHGGRFLMVLTYGQTFFNLMFFKTDIKPLMLT